MFLSRLNYGDIGSVLINHLHIVIPIYTHAIIQICVLINHNKTRTHTHHTTTTTHTHTQHTHTQHTHTHKLIIYTIYTIK